MKKITLLIFANCFLFFSCSSSKHIDRFQKIQYKSITRGYSTQILLQGDTLKYFQNNNETLSLIISKEVKNSLNKLLKKVSSRNTSIHLKLLQINFNMMELCIQP
jgi:hypothetical protein